MPCLAPFTRHIYLSWPKGSKCFRAVLHSRLVFVPLRGGDQSSLCLHIRTDCALFYFTYLTHSYSDNTALQKKTCRCGKLTATLVVVLLARFLMQCMDAESNPGPGSKYNWGGGSNSAAWRQATGRSTPQPAQHYDTQPDPSRRSHRLSCSCYQEDRIVPNTAGREDRQAPKASGPRPSGPGKRHCTLTEQHRSLQAENESLKEDVKYLSARCESLQQYCENLYYWQDQLSSATRELDDHLDRLDAFSRKNNLRFFNVHEGPGEDYMSCARKVVQLLNRFFHFKTWRPEDLEQAHRVGPKRRKDGSRPPTLVARFHTWPDKLSLLEGKDARKDMADTSGIRMAADLTDRQHKELQRQKDQGRIAYYCNGRLCFKGKRRSSHRGYPAGHDRRQHERMRQRQHHDHPEHSREHERTLDNTPLPTVDMNEYPALQRQ